MNDAELARRAQELDRYLDGLPAGLPAGEAHLAKELVTLKSRLSPDPTFARNLARRLTAAAEQNRRPPHPNNPQANRVWLPLGSILFVFILIALTAPYLGKIWPVLPPSLALTTIAERVAFAPVPTPAPPAEQNAHPTEPVKQLEPEVSSIEWSLPTAFPSGPEMAATFRTKPAGKLSEAAAAGLARRLGLKGTIFVPPGESGDLYSITGGLSRAWFYDADTFSMILESSAGSPTPAPLPPFEKLAVAAEAYLARAGLLTFDYAVHPGATNPAEVNLAPVLAGIPVHDSASPSMGATVLMSPSGEIRALHYHRPQLERAGECRLAHSYSAWQTALAVQSGDLLAWVLPGEVENGDARPTRASIERIELVYAPAPGEDPARDADMVPVWLFSGAFDNGAGFELQVNACQEPDR